MSPHPQRTALDDQIEQGVYDPPRDDAEMTGGFDPVQWQEGEASREFRGAGGRQVLGIALGVLAVLWLGYIAWAAGRALSGEPLASPAIAQWVALAAGPLALMGLVWLMFGRTRRKEAERFTRSVVAMRSEARSLEALLEVLSQRINDSRSELTMITQHLIQLGDQASGKFAGITAELDSSSERLVRNGEALDRAAEAARNDIAVLLDDLPRAEQTARTMAEQLRSAGNEAARNAAGFADNVSVLSGRAREAQETVTAAVEALVGQLAQVEAAGSSAAVRVGEANTALSGTAEGLLERTVATLDQIRAGIDTQAAAVAALVEQASAGIGRAGIEAAETLGASVNQAHGALDGLSTRVAEQERASQRIAAETQRALAELDQHFTELAEHGDRRAASFIQAIGQARDELQHFSGETAGQESTMALLTERTTVLRDTLAGLSAALVDAESGTGRLGEATAAMKPEIEWMRSAAAEASEHIGASAASIAEQQDRFAALLATVDDGVGDAQSKLSELASTLAQVEREAANLSAETGPALVSSLVQVKEAASHAAERAREAIEAVIPESASKLSEEARRALEQVIREEVTQSLQEVEATAARAVDAARSASDRLTQQMLSIGQSAAALEQHMEQVSAAQRENDSEAFARRVSLLIDSMHSASIDVGKILSDEVDDKAWDSYIKGNRGVFTRRAARLLENSESRAIRAHYEIEPEFQQSVNRYVHDFEAMLRRVLAERDGGMIAVTMMSSDMGKLYAALAQAVDKRR